MKIMIIGYSGSGKSTLASKLGKKYNLKPLFLDTVHWLPNWVERDFEDEKRIVEEYLNSNDNWLIDGNYSKLSYKRRLEESDLIILMQFNRFVCLKRALIRKRKYKNKTRESITDGCIEKVDLEFIWWILYKGRDKKKRLNYENIKKTYANKIVIIKNQKELDRYYIKEGL